MDPSRSDQAGTSKPHNSRFPGTRSSSFCWRQFLWRGEVWILNLGRIARFCRQRRIHWEEAVVIGRLLSGGSAGVGSKCLRTLLAWAKCSQVVVTENSRRVAIIEVDLYRVVSYLRGPLRPQLRFIHRQKRRRGNIHWPRGFFFCAFVVASGTGAVIPQKRKIKMA